MAQVPQSGPSEYFKSYEATGSPGGTAKGAVANLLAALAAMALAAAAFFHPYADCVPIHIDYNTAQFETELFNLEEGQEVSWFLVEGSGLQELPPLDPDDLTLLLDTVSQIFLDELKSGTNYTLVFTTPGEDGEPTLFHTFPFRTPGEPPAPPPAGPDNSSSEALTPPAENTGEDGKQEEEKKEEEPEKEEEKKEEDKKPVTGGGNTPDDSDGGDYGGGSSTPSEPAIAEAPTASFPANVDFVQYNISFPFDLKNNTLNYVSVTGPDNDGQLITQDFSPGDPWITVEGTRTILLIPGAYLNGNATYTATAYYTSPNSASGQVSSSYTFYPSYLGSASGIAYRDTNGDNVIFQVTVDGNQIGTLGLRVNGVTASIGGASLGIQMSSRSAFQSFVLSSNDPFTLTFTAPVGAVFPDNQELVDVDIRIFASYALPGTDGDIAPEQIVDCTIRADYWALPPGDDTDPTPGGPDTPSTYVYPAGGDSTATDDTTTEGGDVSTDDTTDNEEDTNDTIINGDATADPPSEGRNSIFAYSPPEENPSTPIGAPPSPVEDPSSEIKSMPKARIPQIAYVPPEDEENPPDNP